MAKIPRMQEVYNWEGPGGVRSYLFEPVCPVSKGDGDYNAEAYVCAHPHERLEQLHLEGRVKHDTE